MANTKSTIKEIKTSLEGIGHILSDRQIAVPPYQRSYAWGETQVNDMLLDLIDAMKDGLEEYFLGSIVIIKGRGEFELPQLVDGQQRLATVTILLAAIRDYFEELGEKDRADTIANKYLFLKDLRTQELIPRLRLNQIDHDFFTKKVLSSPRSEERGVAPSKDSHKRISEAADKAKQHISKIAQIARDKVTSMIDIVEYLDLNVPVICVEVPDHANAFRIFETLNDRGLELAISDLLKNYLFHLSDNRMDEVQQRWMSMLGTLEVVGGEEIAVQYIRHFWSSKHGLTRERDLYDRIKDTVTGKQPAINFANELSENAQIYAGIINTDHEMWTQYGATTQGHMATLNTMGMIQIRPLLLSILGSFPPDEVRKSLKMFVSWAVRFLIVGGLGGGTLENYYSERAKEITDKKIKTAKELALAMKEVVPTDSEFETEFATATISKPALARYYLRALERQARGGSDPELVPNPNEEQINLEHILPQTPSEEWGSLDAEVVKGNYRRLGNMALLKNKINSAIGNKGFDEKKPHYKDSEFILTKDIRNYTVWTPAEIQSRQEALAKLALLTWPNKI